MGKVLRHRPVSPRRFLLLVLLASSTAALALFAFLSGPTDVVRPASTSGGAGASWAAAPLVALAIVGGSGALVATLVARPGGR